MVLFVIARSFAKRDDAAIQLNGSDHHDAVSMIDGLCGRLSLIARGGNGYL
jgi:hypothetical protein